MRNQAPSATNTQLGHDMWNGPVRFDRTLATVASESQRRPIVSLGQLDVTEALGPWANLRAQVLH